MEYSTRTFGNVTIMTPMTAREREARVLKRIAIAVLIVLAVIGSGFEESQRVHSIDAAAIMSNSAHD